jgi:hypothetical protein
MASNNIKNEATINMTFDNVLFILILKKLTYNQWYPYIFK